jgi:hypothetical protein
LEVQGLWGDVLMVEEREEFLLALEERALLTAAQLTEALRAEGVLGDEERVVFVVEDVDLFGRSDTISE